MSPTRREFIRRIGIALASLAAARCAWPGEKGAPTPEKTVAVVCYEPEVMITSTPLPTTQLDKQGAILTAVAQGEDVDPEVARQALVAFHRDRLRSCWYRFDWLAQQAHGNYERGENAREELAAEHRAALDELVATGELETTIADELEAAFAAAANHILWSNAPITCYDTAMPDYTPTSAGQLVNQAELLEDLADDATVDQGAVAHAQAAIERDITFLAMTNEEWQALYQELVRAAGESYDYPAFDELDLEITPEAAEAARFLVELLLQD
jgi:hypothetical protein